MNRFPPLPYSNFMSRKPPGSRTKYTSDPPKLCDPKRLEILIDGYIKETHDRFVSSDIITIICNFYDISKIAFISIIKNHPQSSKIMEFIDIYTNKRYGVNILFSSYQNVFDEQYISNETGKGFVEQNCELPTKIMQTVKSKFIFEYVSNSTFSSKNHWSLIFRFDEKISHITAFHPSVCFENRDKMMQTNNCNNLESLSYIGYNLKIPNIPNRSISSVVYNRSDQSLYAFNDDTVYSLDFMSEGIDDHDFDDYNIANKQSLEWNVWKKDKNIKIMNGATCMVDNGRFIAVINANNNKKSYLFAMNETKICIPLVDSCKKRTNAVSIYHDLYYKIITVGEYSAEWYDINKDKSTIFAQCEWENAQNIWYSPFNPHILYGVTTKMVKSKHYYNNIDIDLFHIDLREKQCKSHHIVKYSDGDGSKWCDALYLRM